VKDLKDIPDNIKQDLNIKPVRWIDEVLTAAIRGYSQRLPRKSKKVKTKSSVVSVAKKVKLRKSDRIRAH
jgi:ATP-dependent Lon protease